jgi:pilus assembly protein CpaC
MLDPKPRPHSRGVAEAARWLASQATVAVALLAYAWPAALAQPPREGEPRRLYPLPASRLAPAPPASRGSPVPIASRPGTERPQSPIRLVQATAPVVDSPQDRMIQAIPPPSGGPAAASRTSNRLPYQPRLPSDLPTDPQTTPESIRHMERFIPKIIDPQQDLNLIVGRPRILSFAEWATKPQIRLYLPDENIVRWDILSDTEIAIVGLKPGTTVLTIWFNDPTVEGGKRPVSFRVQVFDDPQNRNTLADLEKQINEIFPDSHVKLSMIRDRLVVRGQAKDAIEAGHIVMILAQAQNENVTGEVTSGTHVKQNTQLQFLDPADDFLREEAAADRRAVYDPVAIGSSGIINLLQIPGEQQITLRVIVAEVNREAIRTIGADMRIGGGGDVSFVSLLMPSGFLSSAGGNLSVNSTDFQLALNALRRMGYARTLAEPNLTTLNGRPASFRAGDTYPVPNAIAGFGGVGQGVIQQFAGVRLQFTPHLVDRDRIRVQISGQVSARDDAQSANIQGTSVPGQNTRDFFTTVELRDGQTLALAGLLQTGMEGNARRVPYLGDLPVIGGLFTDKRNLATEQELVVLVTPELAHPLEGCPLPPLPGADLIEPTDREFYWQNRLESRRATDFRSPVRTDFGRIRSFEQQCRDPHIVGPTAYGVPPSAVPSQARVPLSPLPQPTEELPPVEGRAAE